MATGSRPNPSESFRYGFRAPLAPAGQGEPALCFGIGDAGGEARGKRFVIGLFLRVSISAAMI